MDYVPNFISDLLEQLSFSNVLAVVIILAVGFVAQRFIPMIVHRIVFRSRPLSRKELTQGAKQRRDTLAGIIGGIFALALWFLIGMAILAQLGVNIAPFLAGAGIAGIALGFGGQFLVKDLIAGAFIIAENQYRVGDVVTVGGISGFVEEITLRVTVLRDLDGVKHFVPNGVGDTTSNMTYDFGGVNLDVGVDYASDIEHVIKVVNKVGESIANDDAWKKDIIEAPQFERVDAFADSAIMIKILGKTKPLRQWDVMGEMRKRLKIAFDKEGIVIPYPQRVIHTAKD